MTGVDLNHVWALASVRTLRLAPRECRHADVAYTSEYFRENSSSMMQVRTTVDVQSNFPQLQSLLYLSYKPFLEENHVSPCLEWKLDHALVISEVPQGQSPRMPELTEACFSGLQFYAKQISDIWPKAEHLLLSGFRHRVIKVILGFHSA